MRLVHSIIWVLNIQQNCNSSDAKYLLRTYRYLYILAQDDLYFYISSTNDLYFMPYSASITHINSVLIVADKVFETSKVL